MRSMTGFGEAHRETERYRISVALRSVNHRFLDLAIRLRDELRELEPELRARLVRRLFRGRVEVGVEALATVGRTVEVIVDRDGVAALRRVAAELAAEGVVGEPTLADLLRLPDLVKLSQRDPAWGDDERRALLSAVDAAAEALVAAREVEGRSLQTVLDGHRHGLIQLVERLRERAATTPALLAEAIRRRVAEALADRPLDEGRLAQEVAYLADRADVREELDRLASHLEQLASLFGEPDGIGKRLDFLSQEIARELNTVASKSRDAEMTRWVVEAKAVCEQIREQVQNVE